MEATINRTPTKVGDRLTIPGKRGKIIRARVANVYPNGECRWVEETERGDYMWEIPLYVIREYLEKVDCALLLVVESHTEEGR